METREAYPAFRGFLIRLEIVSIESSDPRIFLTLPATAFFDSEGRPAQILFASFCHSRHSGNRAARRAAFVVLREVAKSSNLLTPKLIACSLATISPIALAIHN